VVDEERVARLLQRVTRDAAYLTARRGLPAADLLADETALAAVKYRFITAIEGAARVAHHITVSEGWAAPETNAAAFRELGERGVVSADLAAALARAAGLRNLLVHQYADVDDTTVVASLHRVTDLDDFVAQVARWLRATPG
jgi:uncharacterized protein YutE (UPF0331/DUF86 family)